MKKTTKLNMNPGYVTRPQDKKSKVNKLNADYQKMENPFQNFTYGKQYEINPYWTLSIENKTKIAMKVQCDSGKMIWVRTDFFVPLEDWREDQLKKTLK